MLYGTFLIQSGIQFEYFDCEVYFYSSLIQINISDYNPSINFRAILLATLRHVVQIHRTVITQ